MSYPFFPVNKAKQQEMDKATKDIEKILNPQEYSYKSPTEMTKGEYEEFLETQNQEREARIEAEKERRRSARILVYACLILGIAGLVFGLYSHDIESLTGGWVAVICSSLGIICLIKHFFGPYGASIGFWGIVGFILCFFGIMNGFAAIGFSITP
ncbi:MAG: hypothetical protein FWE24_07715 [Defluviitaleaceae bacterium]|nr:hypothetical protein [Defluviitaleaceae bacterium]